jgi:hypothetical protein
MCPICTVGGVVGDEGDVEEYDARVDGQVDALPLGQRRRVVRPSRRSPQYYWGQDERGDGGSSAGNETAAVHGAVGVGGPRDKEASAAGGGEEEVQGGGGGGAGGHWRRGETWAAAAALLVAARSLRSLAYPRACA